MIISFAYNYTILITFDFFSYSGFSDKGGGGAHREEAAS